MCSISGILNGDKTSLSKMIDVQRHRAPDENGVFIKDNVYLGMGRLKIIDLKSENLCPFVDEDIVVCFNGEIYNFIELRSELKALNYKFKSNSDIEVLAYCWKQWRYKMFEKINGMFAFCIFEKKTTKLYFQETYLVKNHYIILKRVKSFIFLQKQKL